MNPSATISRAAARGGTTITLARMGSAAQSAIPCTPPVPFRRQVSGEDAVDIGDMSVWVNASDVAQVPETGDIATVSGEQYNVQGRTVLEYGGTQGYELQLRRRG